MKINRVFKVTALLLLLSAAVPLKVVYSAGLILTAPPRETVTAGEKQYGPIAKSLSEVLGVTVEYKHPKNWLVYQREMRNDKYDIVFDGPHFVSWRVANLGHEPLVKLPGTLQFVLLSMKDNNGVNSPNDLVGKRICAISPPHLSILAVLSNYKNPVRQPIIKGIKGGMGKVAKSFFSQKAGCEAMVLRTLFANKKLKPEQREKLKTIFLSKAMPNQAVSVSKRVSPEQREKIKKALTVGKSVESALPVVKRFSKKAKSFIPVKKGEYDSYNLLLEGVIFGW